MISMDALKSKDREIYDNVRREIEREEYSLILIASENYVHQEILEAQGTVLTNKYAEGYPDRRFYGGCQFADAIEGIAVSRAKELFGAEHANVQPHSGSRRTWRSSMPFFSRATRSSAWISPTAATSPTVRGRASRAGSFRPFTYHVSEKTEEIDYDEVREVALREKPKLIIAGASAYSRIIDFKRFREIADEIGAFFMVDIAHIAGAVATGLHPTPGRHRPFRHHHDP